MSRAAAVRFFRLMPVQRVLGRATTGLYAQFRACCLAANDQRERASEFHPLDTVAGQVEKTCKD